MQTSWTTFYMCGTLIYTHRLHWVVWVIIRTDSEGVSAGFTGAIWMFDLSFDQYKLLLPACDSGCLNQSTSGRVGCFRFSSRWSIPPLFCRILDGVFVPASCVTLIQSIDHFISMNKDALMIGTVACFRPMVTHLTLVLSNGCWTEDLKWDNYHFEELHFCHCYCNLFLDCPL